MDESVKKRMQDSIMRVDATDEILEKTALKTATLLADCVEQLSKESNPAQLAYTTAKATACLEILKFTRDE